LLTTSSVNRFLQSNLFLKELKHHHLHSREKPKSENKRMSLVTILYILKIKAPNSQDQNTFSKI